MFGINEQTAASSCVTSNVQSKDCRVSNSLSGTDEVIRSDQSPNNLQSQLPFHPSIEQTVEKSQSHVLSSKKSSNIVRASSNLELLSLTAVWQEENIDCEPSSDVGTTIEVETTAALTKIPSTHKFVTSDVTKLSLDDKSNQLNVNPIASSTFTANESSMTKMNITATVDEPTIALKNVNSSSVIFQKSNDSMTIHEKQIHTIGTSSIPSSTATPADNQISTIGYTRSTTPVDNIVRNSSFLPPPLSVGSTFTYVNSPTGCQYGFIVGIADTDNDGDMLIGSPSMKINHAFFAQVPNISTTPAGFREYAMPKLPSELFLFGAAKQEEPQQCSVKGTAEINTKDAKLEIQSPTTIVTTSSTNSSLTAESNCNNFNNNIQSSSSSHAKLEPRYANNYLGNTSAYSQLSEHTTNHVNHVDSRMATNSSNSKSSETASQESTTLNDRNSGQVGGNIDIESIQQAFQPPHQSTFPNRPSMENTIVHPIRDSAVLRNQTYTSCNPPSSTSDPNGSTNSCTTNSFQSVAVRTIPTTDFKTTSTVLVPSSVATATTINPNTALSIQQQPPNGIAGFQTNLPFYNGSYQNFAQSSMDHSHLHPTGNTFVAGGNNVVTGPQVSSNYPSSFLSQIPQHQASTVQATISTSSYASESDFTLVAAAATGRENVILRQSLAELQATIQSLQEKVEQLESENSQLRQLPTGKISQIPIEDMIELMHVYGSEVSDTAMPPRKSCVQKASVIRQFRRWNPNFSEYFEFRNGRWVPKLGKEAEIKRRDGARREAATIKKKPTKRISG